MNPLWRARLRRLRFALLGTAAACVIALGVLAGLAHLAMPWFSHHPQTVARWLGERLGRPVTIGRLDGSWRDTVIYSMTDDDWPAAQSRLRALLDR